MFEDVHPGYVFLPIMFGAAIYAKFIKRDTGDPVRDKLKDVQIMLIGFGAVLMVLWFSLPITPSLSTFGYPDTVDQVDTPKEVLKYLQEYNKAIVKTTEVIHWLLFIFTFWFITAFHGLIKALKANRDKKLENKAK
jgi:hypothetical protein